MTTIEQWFDPQNRVHIEAYCELQKTGMWPKGFIPNNIEMPEMPATWHFQITNKIAEAWIKGANTQYQAIEKSFIALQKQTSCDNCLEKNHGCIRTHGSQMCKLSARFKWSDGV